MTITELIKQGFYYARTCRSLWLFGFFVGIASGGSNGGSGGNSGGDGGGDGLGGFLLNFLGLESTAIALIVVAIALVAVAGFVIRFISEGALIEGVVRARQGVRMTTREGFRAGWAHWGVLFRITLAYFAATIGSLALLAAPCVIAIRAISPVAGLLLAIPAVIIAVPWLVTLYLVQAFAARIAVLENRRALDAIAKARLFLHGRLMHGLKLIVATFVGTLALALLASVVLVPAVLLLVALVPLLRVLPVIMIGCLVLLPAIYVLVAMLGTFVSSIWTIGYVTQTES